MEVTSLIIWIGLVVVAVFIIMLLVHFKKPDVYSQHHHFINSFIYLAGAIIALGGLLFTGLQVQQTGLQIQQGARQLEASTVYAVQRDFRELFASAVRSQAYRDYVLGFDQNYEYEPEVIEEAVGYISQVIQLYSAMFMTRSYGLISEEAWRIAYSDLCSYFEVASVRQAWANRFRNTYQRHLPEFVQEVERC